MRTVANPPNPFESQYRELLEPAPPAKVTVFEDASREILSRNDSPDLPFRWSVNPYRGCFHGCAYCYARPSHEYWGFGAGTDFDTKIIVKEEAPVLLRRAYEKPSWQGELIVFSGNTDCYQPLEASYGLTRACLEVCAEYRNRVGVITKGALVRRDLDVLTRLHGARVDAAGKGLEDDALAARRHEIEQDVEVDAGVAAPHEDLPEDYPAVGDHVKHATGRGHQLHGSLREMRFDLSRHPGGSRLVVSNEAVGDGDLHRSGW